MGSRNLTWTSLIRPQHGLNQVCSVVANEPNVCPNVGWVKDFNGGQAIIDVPFNGATITGSPGNNSNWPQLNDPTLNNGLDAARLIIDPAARASEYGKIDDMITAQAPAIPWIGTTNRTSRRRTCSRRSTSSMR